MGRRARRRNREGALSGGQAQAVASPPRPEVHITVAATTYLGELDLRHETQLVKAALLYADRVTLASPKALLLASAASLGLMGRRERLDAMAELVQAAD